MTAFVRPGPAVLVLLLTAATTAAQELEPAAYWPLPTGLNIFTVANGFNWGDLAFEPAAPIDEGHARVNATALGFTSAFSLAGRSANASVAVPVVAGHLEGIYLGAFAQADRFGLGDPRAKLAVNLYGAPAMTLTEFASYRQRGIVGVSVTVAFPLGQYDPARLINVGTNRWSFKPELGVSQTFGRWIVELMAGVWLFTDNPEFFGGRTREQAPVGEAQVHLAYKFAPTMWIGANANYYTGGRTTIGGRRGTDLQRNSRIGATFSSGLSARQSVRLAFSRGRTPPSATTSPRSPPATTTSGRADHGRLGRQVVATPCPSNHVQSCSAERAPQLTRG